MATFSHTNSRRMYSWWWDSHISPKNSKWLQENLTDMDAKVKSMIKLIEEDADSFARRAEMYYKKRPELMKMVEEFYRAYRALAERYDHATGVIRHAHRTMTEAFPNQVPPMLDDSGTESQTPDMSTPARGFFEPDDLQNESLGHSDSHFNDAKRNGSKFVEGKVRKSLKFHESVDSHQKHSLANSESDQPKESEEILSLKKALAELQAEKEAGLSQYKQSLEKLSALESQISRIQEDSKGLAEQASQAEAEAQSLKENLAKLEAERESNLLQYRHCLEKISGLEDSVSHAEKDAEELNQRAINAETEAQSVKDELAKVSAEKDAALDQYVSSLEFIANLEHKLKCAEETAAKFKERAEKAENEVERLKQSITKLREEKEAAELEYHQCMETISRLENNLSLAQEEAQRLKTEIEKGVTDLKGSEEQRLLLERTNQSLHSELEALILKTGSQSQELTEKQKELGRLWTCIQEERLRFVEAETAFQTLQHLHAQAQEELRSLAFELQNKVQTLAETDTQKKNLHDEVLKVKEENKSLNELSVSSAITIKDLQNEISNLTEAKGKLEEEVELRVDQRNALQQEIYCMKEELNDLNKKNSTFMAQVHATGLDADSFGSAVRELQDDNSKLKEACERERNEKLALLGKLEILEHLIEKNSMLENSLSDLNAELEAVREKIQSLEESCQCLVDEKSSLLDEKASLQVQLQVASENLGELTEKNTALENSLCDARDELEVLKTKSMNLEESCNLLANEKGRVAAEKDILTGQLESNQMRLENLENRYAEMGERYSALEKEKELSVVKIQELETSLAVQKQDYLNLCHANEIHLASMKDEMQLLQDEIKFTKTELEMELDNNFESHTEVFILRRCARDLEEKNLSLSTKNQELLETTISLEGMLTNLKQDNMNQKLEIVSLSDHGSTLRKGIDKLLKALDIVLEHEYDGRRGQDHIYLNHILSKLEDIKTCFCKTEEETLHHAVEFSVLLAMLGDLAYHLKNLESEKCSIEQEFSSRSRELLASQNEALMLHQVKEEMKMKVMEGEETQKALQTQISDLWQRVMDLQGSCQDLERGNVEILREKESLTNEFLQLEKNSQVLEVENSALCSEILSLDCFSILLRNCIGEKSVEFSKLVKQLHNLNVDNDDIRQRLYATEQRLEELLILKEMELQKLREEHQHTKIQEQSLRSELHVVKNEADIWEAHALDTFVELQISNIFQVLYEEKIHELTKTCESFKDENATKDTELKCLRERASALASENEGLNAKLAAFVPAIALLGAHMLSLEEQTCLQGHPEVSENADLKDDATLGDHARGNSTNHNEVVDDPLLHLQSLQRRIQFIEEAVTSKEQLMSLENQSVHAELEAAMKLIADLKSENSQRRRNSKPMSEVDNGLLTKDIMLDQVSEFSPYRSSRREQVDPDSRSLESWETIDQDGSIDLTVSKTSKMVNPSTDRTASFHRVKSAKKQKNDLPTVEILVEKELGVDKLEISKRFSEPLQEGNKRKVLERLNSDVQKLTNLQITVQDLKRKLEVIGKSKKGKAIDECDILKEQLEEADAAILKLFDLNGRLTKNVESGTPLSSHHSKSSSMDSDENGSSKKRKVTEQARRVSERIGRLQLEVQKIQFVLLKLDDEKDGKGKSKAAETKRRVLLRDYLYGYGVIRSSHRRKRTPFCGCVQPRTEGD